MIEFCKFLNDKAVKQQVKSLYKRAFPAEERLPFSLLCRKAKRNKGEFFAIKDDKDFVGLAYTVIHKDVVYLFFLAVENALRGKGYGSQILQHLKEIYRGKKIILNIEELNPSAENYAERLKRKGFYEHNGFALANIKSYEKGVAYDMMVYGGNVTYNDYASLIKSFLGCAAYKLFYREIKNKAQ